MTEQMLLSACALVIIGVFQCDKKELLVEALKLIIQLSLFRTDQSIQQIFHIF
jgi:hypothetical protein